MSRLTKRILLTALLGLFLTAPGVVRSQGFDAKTLMRAQQRGQTGSLYGNNPFEQPAEEGEEGERRSRRIRPRRSARSASRSNRIFSAIRSAPLNNFRWSVRRDYNRVGDRPAGHDADRLAHRLSVLPRRGGRHRAGRPRTGFAAYELFPAAPELRLRFRESLLCVHVRHGERARSTIRRSRSSA